MTNSELAEAIARACEHEAYGLDGKCLDCEHYEKDADNDQVAIP